MRKFTFLAVMFCIFGFSNIINAQWNPLTSGTSKTLESVYFTDTNTGYAVGWGGTILKTDNGGTNWITQTSGTLADLWSVYFTDANTGYSVGYDWDNSKGVILKTINAGTDWIIQIIGSSNPINNVYFTDANNGYTVGQFGIRKTSNAGTSWSLILGSSKFLYSVYFTDLNNGYVVGSDGTILKTSNAGTSWISQTSGTTNWLFSVYFTDVNTGYVVGNGGTILKTNNAGTNWVAQTSGITGNLWSVFFYDSNNGYAVGSDGTILKTSDAGTNWISQTSGTTQWLKSVYFTDSNIGYVVGNYGTMFKTINGGEITPIPSAPTNLTLNSLKNTLSKMILSWMDNSYNEDGFRIYRSTDDANYTEIGTTATNINTYTDSTGEASTLYYYRVKAYNSAGSSTFSNTISGTTSDIHEISENKTISVYPNPTTGKLSISASNNINTFEIFNLIGEKVYEKNFNQEKSIEIDISNTPCGIYFLKVSDGDKVNTRKIVLQ